VQLDPQFISEFDQDSAFFRDIVKKLFDNGDFDSWMDVIQDLRTVSKSTGIDATAARLRLVAAISNQEAVATTLFASAYIGLVGAITS